LLTRVATPLKTLLTSESGMRRHPAHMIFRTDPRASTWRGYPIGRIARVQIPELSGRSPAQDTGALDWGVAFRESSPLLEQPCPIAIHRGRSTRDAHWIHSLPSQRFCPTWTQRVQYHLPPLLPAAAPSSPPPAPSRNSWTKPPSFRRLMPPFTKRSANQALPHLLGRLQNPPQASRHL